MHPTTTSQASSHVHLLDHLVVAAYLLLALGLGIYFGRHTRGVDDEVS